MSTVQASGVRWDLSPLFASAEAAEAAIGPSLERARAFEAAWRGRMAELTAAQLADALHELGEIDNELSRIASYTMLRKAVDVTSEQNRDLGAAVDAAIVQARNALRFFELEWLALDDERAGELLAAPEVAADRHYLTAQRRYRDHVLSEPEERALGERDPAAVSAWQTLYAQTTSTIEVPFDSGDGPQPHTIDRLLAYVHDSRRDVRLAALDTLYAALEAPAPVLAHCYDSLVADRLVSDRLRSYGDDPMLPTHLDNELDAPVVQAMLEQVEARYPLAQRWFRAKASMMGLDVLELADQYAPLGEARAVGYDEGRSLVDAAFTGFSPQVASIAEAFFTEQRVDAEPRAGKRGGAFCSPVAQDASPYVMLNYTDTMNDVLTIAHELGHGMHFQLAHAAQTPHSAHTGLALAEVPSTFAEFVAYDHLLANEEDRLDAAGADLRARRGRVRDHLPPDRAWPATSRAPTGCGPARRRSQSTASATSGSSRTCVTTATASTCRTATGWAGRTSPTSSRPASTPTPTCSRSWSRWRCTRAGGRRARSSWSPT